MRINKLHTATWYGCEFVSVFLFCLRLKQTQQMCNESNKKKDKQLLCCMSEWKMYLQNIISQHFLLVLLKFYLYIRFFFFYFWKLLTSFYFIELLLAVVLKLEVFHCNTLLFLGRELIILSHRNLSYIYWYWWTSLGLVEIRGAYQNHSCKYIYIYTS